MGKKKSRAHSVSKGERRNVVNGLAGQTSDIDRMMNKLSAWKKGKPVTVLDAEGKKGPANLIWGRPGKANVMSDRGKG